MTALSPVIGNLGRRVSNGVFPYLVNTTAFLDKVEFGLWGTRRARILSDISVQRSIAIAGTNRPYARSLHGVCQPTDNPFELRYGRLQPWPNLPPMRLIGRSDALPLTGSQMALIANAFLRQGYRAEVFLVEATFDVKNISIPYFRSHLMTRSRTFHELRDHRGRETLYIGSRRSPSQARIYQKTDEIVRVEYVLKRSFLLAHGIRWPDDLLRVGTLNFANLARFPEFDGPRLRKTLNATANFWGKDLLLESPHRWPLRTLYEILRWRGRIDAASLLRPSEADAVLSRMQHNLVW
jgi:hypothetical protein